MRKLTRDTSEKKRRKRNKMAIATEAPKAPLTSEMKIRDDLEEKIPKLCKILLSLIPFGFDFH